MRSVVQRVQFTLKDISRILQYAPRAHERVNAQRPNEDQTTADDFSNRQFYGSFVHDCVSGQRLFHQILGRTPEQ